MLRRVLLLGVLGVVAVGLPMGIIWWRSGPGAPDAGGPASEGAHASPSKLLGPDYRANTILDNPFPDDPGLAASRVSLERDRADVNSVLEELAAAGGAPITPPADPPRNRPEPLVDLHVKNQPWLEALFQVEAQASLTVLLLPGKDVTTRFTPKRALPGTWCVSGPFAFVITGIDHTYQLDRDGQPFRATSDASPRPESLIVALSTFAEPKLNLLQFPMEIRLLEVVDENGHSLIPEEPYWGGRKTPLPPSVFQNTHFMLAYPKDKPGRTIKRFKANGDFVVQLGTERVEVPNPADDTTAEKTVGGMKVSVAPLTWNPQNHFGNVMVTYHQGTLDKAAWTALRPALHMARITVHPAIPNDSSLRYGLNESEQDPAAITVRYSIAPINPPGNPPPEVTSFTFDVPTAARQVTVPFEFHDLPLP